MRRLLAGLALTVALSVGLCATPAQAAPPGTPNPQPPPSGQGCYARFDSWRWLDCYHRGHGHAHPQAQLQREWRQLLRYLRGSAQPSGGVTGLITQAAQRYGVSASLMLAIARCESGLNPGAYNASSGASGLFQHLARYWPPRAAAVGLPGASPFDPWANALAAAWMLSTQGTSPWNASRSCWG